MNEVSPSKQNEYIELITDIIGIAKQQGASSSEASLGVNNGLAINVRNQNLDTVEFDNGKGMSITVYFGNKKGAASTSDFSEEAITATVKKACTIAKIMAEDECCGLADAKLMAYDKSELNRLYPWGINADEAKKIALDCEQYGLSYNNKITNTEGASVNTTTNYGVYANSHGFVGKQYGTKHSVSCVLVAKQKDKMQRDYYYSIARNHNDLLDIKSIGETAAKRTIARLNPRVVKTQQAPILFSPEMARGLFSSFVSAISGGNLYRESSFLLNKLGENIFPKNITIIEDPFLDKGLASAYFDNDGVRTSKRVLVENGVLNGYILSNYSAKRLKMTTTGNSGGIHNLIIQNGSNTYSDLIKQLNKGLIVTELMGQGINIINGDYSRGASGFWVENGEIQYPVEGITIAGNLADMFNGIVEVGSDVDKRGVIQTGSVLINNMMIAGS